MPKRKRSDGSDSDDNFPALLQLSCRNFARELWLQVIKHTTLPIESSKLDQPFIERCKNELLEILNQNDQMIPSHCKTTIVAQVNCVMRDIIDEFSSYNISLLMSHVLETPKWNYFASSIWNCVKDKVPQQRIIFMFEWIVKKIDEIGFDAIPEDELAVYLEIWANLPKDLKMRVFENSSYYYSRRKKHRGLAKHDAEWVAKLKTLPRDLRFLQKLFADFDLATRNKMWRENWFYLIFGASLTSLHSLMKMCCQAEDEIEQFKSEWLARNEIIDNYYSRLLEWRCYAELNQYLSFYSTIESEILDLAEKILHAYFSRNVIHFLGVDSYSDTVKIARSGGWLEKAIKGPTFEYHLRKDDVKMKLQCRWFLHEGSFDGMRDFLSFFLPEEEIVVYERRFLRFFFLENSSPIQDIADHRLFFSMWRFSFLTKLDEFDAYINRVFSSADEVVAFKKDIIFARFTYESLLDYLDRKSGDSSEVQKFVTMCLSCEQDVSRWKERFMEHALQSIRLPRHLEGLFHKEDNIMSWCLDSEEKMTEFQVNTLPIGEIFPIMERALSGKSADVYTLRNVANNIIKWWITDVQEMADFKISKLRKCADDDPMLEALLKDNKDGYLQSENDDLKRYFVLASCIPR
ncbi:uncharacterized protein LOC135831758 isoform X1 [Planococcus citri]|uniref:uncharacterized protein LOC135831758 isoform X1 n=1 Tax=Planococcus citri TaxID=170843 RepID=UPI0031F9DABF